MNDELANMQKQHAHAMIERLTPEMLSAVVVLLGVMTGPLDQALATEKKLQVIEYSHNWPRHDQYDSFEQVVTELGFTMEEIPNYKDPPRVSLSFSPTK